MWKKSLKKGKKLSPKRQRFVDEYVVDLNGTQAAIRAGYSEKTAASQAERLLRNVDVAAEIAEKLQKISEETEIDAKWVRIRLQDELEADVADLYEGDGLTIKPVNEWPKIFRTGLTVGIDVTTTKIGEDSHSQITRIRISDKIKRLELLGKHTDVQAFLEKRETEHKGEVIVRRNLDGVKRDQENE